MGSVISPAHLFIATVCILLAIAYVHLTLIKGIHRIMSALDDLKTQYTDLKAKADSMIDALGQQTTSIAALNARILGLEQQIDAGGADEQTLRALIDDMRAETTKMSSAMPLAVRDAIDASAAAGTTSTPAKEAAGAEAAGFKTGTVVTTSASGGGAA